MAIRKASAQTTINRGTVAAAVATVNQITIAPATVASVAGGGSLGGGGTISNVAITDATYTTVLSGDTAVSTAGGFIRITGTGFRSGANVYLGSTLLTNTFVSSTTINAVVPATSAGSYNLFVMNPDNNGVIGPPVATSGFPTFSQTSYTVASLTLNTQLLATGDAPLTYYIQPGSSNPQNLSVSTSGLLTGTLPSDATYTLTVIVDDVQGQSTQATINIIAQTSEPYFNLTTLSLPGDGTNNAQNNTFLDSSSNNFTITRNGNTTQGSYSPFSQTGWGNYFISPNYLRIAYNAAFLWSTGARTFEAWVYLNSTSSNNAIFGLDNESSSNTWELFVNTSGQVVFRYYNGASQTVTTTSTVSTNAWTHIAFTYDGTSVITLYINGVSAGTGTKQGTPITDNNPLLIAHTLIGLAGNAYFNGYISNVRFTSAVVYTGNFTPSTTPLTAITNTSLLTCQSNRFVDNSTNAFAITVINTPSVQTFSPFLPTVAYTPQTIGGSGYFDGTGDFLTLGTSTNLALGAGDFTIDVWLYLTAYNGSLGVIFDWRTAGSTPTNIPLFSLSPSGVPAFWQSVSLGAAITGSSAVPRNTWTHLAVVRNGLGSNNLTMYLNGTSIGSATATNSLGIETLRLNDPQGSFGQAGYFSSARIVKGTAVYTANFTPPTAPLTAIANTQLLLNFTNGGITDATAKNVLETVGDAKISTAQSKFGGSSMYFDGTGDYLKGVYSPNMILSGDFTIECWINFSAHQNYGGIISFATPNTSVAPTSGWALVFYQTTDRLYFEAGGGVGIAATNAVTANQWNHVAVVRSGSTITHYLNGVANGSGTSSATFTPLTTDNFAIGSNRGFDATMTGYLDDIRITRGYARYTANFTPPTAAFSLK